MTRKTKAVVETPKKPTQDEREWAAKLALSPLVNAAAVTEAYQGNIVGKDADVQTLVYGLHESCKTAKDGDMSNLEAMLIGQATALQSIFVSLARRAQVQEYRKNLEAFLALGLKAQAQSRATIQALVELKYPRQVAFVKQANISNGPQQVNNGVGFKTSPRSHAEEKQTEQSKLLEDGPNGGTNLDTGATKDAGGGDSALEAVEALDRANKRRR